MKLWGNRVFFFFRIKQIQGERGLIETFMRSMMVAYFLLAEVDRVNWRIAVHETEKLQKHYQGSISCARCTKPQDEINIRNEIGHQVHQVDKVIQVLLNAGMTSDALREAHLHGVRLQHSGVVQVAIPLLVLGPLLMLGSWHLGRHIFLFYADERVTEVDWYKGSMQAESILSRLGFLILLLRSSIDEKCFMLNVMAKTVAPIWFLYGEMSLQVQRSFSLASLSLYHLSFLVVLFFAVLGYPEN